MTALAFDYETALIRPALLAPPPACVTWQTPGSVPQIADSASIRPLVAAWLSGTMILVGHNVAFDLAVTGQAFPDLLPAIFRAYDADRVTDTMLRQQLLDIASGVYRGRLTPSGFWIKHEYTLEALAKRCAGIQLQKDAWRLSYGNFIGVPLERWRERAVEVQAAARPRIAAIEAVLAGLDAAQAEETDEEDDAPGEGGTGGVAELLGPVLPPTTKAGRKALEKELDGLRQMVASDPDQCKVYPLDDARATLAVYLKQEAHAAAFLADQYRQSRASFWLYLSSAHGGRTDSIGVGVLRMETEAALDEVRGELQSLGLVRTNGKRDTKIAKRRMIDTCLRDGLKLRRTKAHTEGDDLSVAEYTAKGRKPRCKLLDGTPLDDGDARCEVHISLDSDACAASEDLVLVDYSEFSTLKKVLSNDIPALEAGTIWPVHTRYGLAETGRTTSSKPNIQNLRRKAGIREAFVPRAGRVFIQADYPQLELYTLAQCCKTWFGFSKLADILNAGMDPHLAVAADILGISYEVAFRDRKQKYVDDARQIAKVMNFGFPGGLGIEKLIIFARKVYNVVFHPDPDKAIERVKELKEKWKRTLPEMRHHFARVNALCDNPGGLASVETLWTKRQRGGATYCAACNNGFQALGVDCAKEAGWRITRAMYVEPESPLFGSRLPFFVHDEFIGESDEAVAHEAAHELARLMVEGANIYLPDVPIKLEKMEPLTMRRWSKKADPCTNEHGRLVPWEGKLCSVPGCVSGEPGKEKPTMATRLFGETWWCGKHAPKAA